MKRALPYILSVSLFAYLIIVLTFASTKLKEVKCRGLQVAVDDSQENVFIEEEEVLKLIKRGYGDVKDANLAEINKDSIERVLVKNSVIKSAEVYYSLEGYLHVGVMQRKPVLRVMSGDGYYLDEEGKIMPLSHKYTSRVVIATGHISKRFSREALFPFVMRLRDDKFWDALVEQIIVRQDNEIVLIPKVGNFRILVGELEHIEVKLENLRLFLDKGIALKGWNVYKEINLKFENQIVCVRR